MYVLDLLSLFFLRYKGHENPKNKVSYTMDVKIMQKMVKVKEYKKER